MAKRRVIVKGAEVNNEGTPTPDLKTDLESGTRCGVPICGARKRRSGETCKNFAGMGTGHYGIGKCKYHGGSTPSHQRHAVRVAAAQSQPKLGVPIEVNPAEALIWTVYASAGHATWIGAQVAALDDLGTHEARVLVEMYGNERDRLTRASKAALDAGIDERRVRIAETHATQLIAAVSRATLAVGLSQDDRQTLNKAIAVEIRGGLDIGTEQAGALVGMGT